MSANEHRYAVVVAGGKGTRLWPLSRTSLPKQMQALMSDQPLIVETIARLEGVIDPARIYVSTTENYSEQMREMLPHIPAENIITEPVARGTAAAFALFTYQIHQRDPDAVVFSLASDHAITEVDKFRDSVKTCFDFVESNRDTLAFVGIRPTRPDTGLGYIKVRQELQSEPLIYAAEKFVEKPSTNVAQSYVDSGEYFWNAGYYCFAASSLLEAYEDADPRLVDAARRFTQSGDPTDFMVAPEKVHEIEVIDSSKYTFAVVPADFRWSDIGNWQALHRVLSGLDVGGVVKNKPEQHVDIGSDNLHVHSSPLDDRIIATAGLDNIAIISTEDVLFVVNMDQLESMPKLHDLLRAQHLEDYL